MGESEKSIVVVLGMHRSGTSAVTRGLPVMGVELGSRLHGGAPGNNDKGFFEDIDVNTFDGDLLHALGHEWHTLSQITLQELAGPIAQNFKPRAIELLRGKLASAGIFGIKDPRMPRLLPFWKDVFAELHVRASYVIACRNPLGIAHSLARRDGFDRTKSYYLWLDHMLASLAHTDECTRVVVDYDQLMEEAAAQIKRVAGALALNFDPASPAFGEYHDEFLEGALRHTRFTMQDLESDPAAPEGVAKLHSILQELAADQSRFDSPHVVSALAELKEQFAKMRPVLAFVRTCDDRVINHDQLVNDRDVQIANLNRQVAALNRAVAERDAQFLAIQASLAWRAQAPLRALFAKYPRLHAVVRRTIRMIWWGVTFQSPEKFRQQSPQPAPLPPYIAPPVNDYALAVPVAYAPVLGDIPRSVAVICHMYFAEMADEFRDYLSNIPFRFDLYITTDTNSKKRTIEHAFAGRTRGRVEVRLAPNRGRDIAPKLITCVDVYATHEYILHIHTKHSLHAPHLVGWRKYLLKTLIGSPAVVTSIFEIFEKQPRVGMIAPRHFESIQPGISWGPNYEYAAELAGRLKFGLDKTRPLDFPSGSMFWARSAALRPLVGIGLSMDDFPVEAGQTDDTPAHAIERLYFHICESAGFDWIKIARRGLLRDTMRGVIDVKTPEELGNFVAYQRVHLLETNYDARSSANDSGESIRRHYVEDYEMQVARFLSDHSLDEAMSLAVGGKTVSDYEAFGQRELQLLKHAGLAPGMRLIDLGCGSGRLASALHNTMDVSYVGIDIVQSLLDYAKKKAPTFEFLLHRELSIPQAGESADLICAFSLFTHLLHAETYLYLEEAVRVLKPTGRIVFSFLEFAEPAHWGTFVHTKNAQKECTPPLNMYIERSAICTWAWRLNLVVEEFISATESIGGYRGLGQSVVILRK